MHVFISSYVFKITYIKCKRPLKLYKFVYYEYIYLFYFFTYFLYI